MVGELRLPGEFLIGRRDETVLALGIAEIILVDKTVVPESLSIAESDLLSAHSGNLQGDPSGEVAASVNNIDTRLRLGDGSGSKRLHHLDRLHLLGNQLADRLVSVVGETPDLVHQASRAVRLEQLGVFLARIEMFAIEYAGVHR